MSKTLLAASLLAGMLGLAGPGHAAWVYRPDNNTLWVENGRNSKVGPTTAGDHWNDGGLKVTPGKNGGIQFSSPDGQHTSVVRSVPFSEKYPYLVCEVTAGQPIPGYQAFVIGFLDPKAVNLTLVGSVAPGIYTCRPFRAAPDPGAAGARVQLGLSFNTIQVASLRMVKKPEQFIELDSPAFKKKRRLDPGDPLTFSLRVKEPADDVVVRFYKNDMFYFGPVVTIGGKRYCWLKAKDGTDRKVWANTIQFKDCVLGVWNKEDPIPLPAGAFLVEAMVKRAGKPDQSLWTCSSFEFKTK